MMTKKATTKRERKYGKKEGDELDKLKPKKKEIKTKKEKEDMYKILMERTWFTPPMNHEKCMEYVNNENKKAMRMLRQPPLMTLVKI